MSTTLDSCASISLPQTTSLARQDYILLNDAKKQQSDLDDRADCHFDALTAGQFPASGISGSSTNEVRDLQMADSEESLACLWR